MTQGSNTTAKESLAAATPDTLGRKLQALALEAHTAAPSEIVRIIAQSIGAFGVCLAKTDASGRPSVDSDHIAPAHLGQLPSLVQQILRLASVAVAEQVPQATTIHTGDELLLVAVPLHLSGENPAALCLAIGITSSQNVSATVSNLTHLLTWVAAYLEQLIRNTVAADDGRTKDVGQHQVQRRLHELVMCAAKKETLGEAAQEIAQGLRLTLNNAAVAIGEYRERHDTCKLVGYSGEMKLDDRAPAVRLIESVMQEAVIVSQLPAEDQDDWPLVATGTTQQLRRTAGLEVTHFVALRDAAGNLFGGLLLLNSENAELQPQSSRTPELLSDESVALLGSILGLSRQAQPRLWRRVGKVVDRWRRHRVMWLAGAIVAMVVLAPLPLRIHCACTVEPQQHRLVAVPYEGKLKESLVEPGQIVEAGQLLARMDDREIQWELSGLSADLGRAEKARDTALAVFDTVASQMAELEAQRLRLRIDLLGDRLQRAEIRSPIDGIVLAGDPSKLEGARVPLGQTILEVGSLDRLMVNLAIADRDISHVVEGQPVRCRLSALPGKRLEGKLLRIRPRSEIRDNNNVFIGEVEFANSDLSLRPGMRGHARIRTGRHPIVWNLFHRAWEQLGLWLI